MTFAGKQGSALMLRKCCNTIGQELQMTICWEWHILPGTPFINLAK